MKLEDAIKQAKELGSYFVTLTTKDKNKEKNNLNHYTFREDFPIDNIINSVDESLRSMKVFAKPPVETVKLNKIEKEKRPLKIAIITHFNKAPESYSPGNAVKQQIKLLKEYGHEVVFFVREGSPLDEDCEMRAVMPAFKREKNIVNEEGKKKLIEVLKKELTPDFDLAITHDFFIDDCITYREAIKECGVDIEWLHWARSGLSRNVDWDMPNARYVYMNDSEAHYFAEKIPTDIKNVRITYNIKDPAYLFKWNPITKMISDKMKLSEKEIIQTYPMCTTRMDAKGLRDVIRIFSELKERGKKVALIICNSNGRKRKESVEEEMKFAKELGLDERDIVFTSTLATKEFPIHNEVPNKIVSELFQISNLFVFPTRAEVCSNVLLEASLSKNLLVLNKDTQCLFDFVSKENILSYPFTSLKNIHYKGKDKNGRKELINKIIDKIENNDADKQFRYVWKNHSREAIYENTLKPILYERVDDKNNEPVLQENSQPKNMKDIEKMPKLLPITILMVSYNRLEMLKKSIDLINERTFYPFRLIVVDNNSTDGSREYLKHCKVIGKVFDNLLLDENVGQSMALNKGLELINSWDIKRRPSSDLFVGTNEDILPPDLKPCWLERLQHLFLKYEPEGFSGISMRIERSSRMDIDEEKELIVLHKSFPNVFRMLRRSDMAKLGDRPFGKLKHWDSHPLATKFTEILKKKFALATHLYASHIGFEAENKGYDPEDKEYFTYPGEEKIKLYEQKPYPEIDDKSLIPINIKSNADKDEHEKRIKYWGQYTDYDISGIKAKDLQNPKRVFGAVRGIEHEELRKHIEGKIVLDLGCANKKIIEDATGVDVFPFPCVDVVAKADDLWWVKDCSVDTVISSHLIEHLPDTKAVLKEWIRVLKPGGILGIVCPDGENARTILDPTHKVALTKTLFKLLMRDIFDMEIIRIESIKTNKPSIICVCRKKGQKEILKNDMIQEDIEKDKKEEVKIRKFGGLSFNIRRGHFDPNPLRDEIEDDCYRIPKNPKVVVDIGAHLGGTSILCASMGAKVYAYEPQIDTYRLLLSNIKLNNLEENIKAFRLGVGTPGERTLYLHSRNSGANCMKLNFIKNKVKGEEKINVISLKQVFEDNNIEKCDLLKSDCEGGEFEFLMEIDDELASKISQISFEYHDIKKINDLKNALKPYYNIEDNGKHILYCYLKK